MAWALGLALVSMVLGGCGTSTVPVNTHPRDEDTAKDLGATIAERGRCERFEHVQTQPGRWVFSCDRHAGDPEANQDFGIQTYADAAAKRAEASRLNAAGFRYKEGPFFLVIAAQRADRPMPPPSVLDGFPGSSPAHHP